MSMLNEQDRGMRRTRETLVGAGFSAIGEGALFDVIAQSRSAKEVGLGLIAIGTTVTYNALNHEPLSVNTRRDTAFKGIAAATAIFVSSYLASRGFSSAETAVMGTAEVAAATGVTLFQRRRHRRS